MEICMFLPGVGELWPGAGQGRQCLASATGTLVPQVHAGGDGLSSHDGPGRSDLAQQTARPATCAQVISAGSSDSARLVLCASCGCDGNAGVLGGIPDASGLGAAQTRL